MNLVLHPMLQRTKQKHLNYLQVQEGSRTDTKEEIIEKGNIVDVINLSDEARKETDQESWRQRYQRRISLDPWMISQQSKETSEMEDILENGSEIASQR